MDNVTKKKIEVYYTGEMEMIRHYVNECKGRGVKFEYNT